MGKFLSPDNITPGAGSQSFNRYTYVKNNPIKYADPTGHYYKTTDAPVEEYDTPISDEEAQTAVTVAIAVSTAQEATKQAEAVAVVEEAINTTVSATTEAVSNNPYAGVEADAVTAGGDNSLATIAVGATGIAVGAAIPGPAPDFVVSPGGDVIPIPEGATGPTPVNSGKGFQYTGGNGGNGLAKGVNNVRIMDPTDPNPPSPGYPNGYANYTNNQGGGKGQAVNPYTGKPVSKNDPTWHNELNPPKSNGSTSSGSGVSETIAGGAGNEHFGGAGLVEECK